MRASRYLTANERESVEQAVADAEHRTSAEIVVAIASESGDYRLCDVAFAAVGMIGLVTLGLGGVTVFAPRHLPLGIVSQLELGLAGLLCGWFAVRSWPGLRLPFTAEMRRQVEAHRAARRVFETQHLGRTTGRSCLLLYVSLFEREVVIRADDKVAEALGPDRLRALRDLARQRLREHRRVEAFSDTVEAAAEYLAPALPPHDLCLDELSNRLLLYDRRP